MTVGGACWFIVAYEKERKCHVILEEGVKAKTDLVAMKGTTEKSLMRKRD